MSKTVQPALTLPRRDRSRAARLAARAAKAAREKRIVAALSSGVSVAEIAAQEGIGERGVRKAVSALLARPRSNAARAYASREIGRLHGELRPSFEAAESGDLAAIGRIVRLVRDLDRFHGLGTAAALRRAVDVVGSGSEKSMAEPNGAASP